MRKPGIGIALVLFVALPATAKRDDFSPPREYLLALGDSLAFGYQQAKFLASDDPSTFDTGFVDDFAARLHQTEAGEHTRVVNYACPGETTGSFAGQDPNVPACAYNKVEDHPLHNDFCEATQLEAAVDFLREHRGDVGIILFSIGANDVNNLVSNCNLSLPCIQAGLPAVLASLAGHLGEDLDALRAAAPRAEIVIGDLYDPYGPFLAGADALALAVNQVIYGVAAARGIRVALNFVKFNQTGDELATICALTNMCTPLRDIHPTDLGYSVMADDYYEAAGYECLPPDEDRDRDHDHHAHR